MTDITPTNVTSLTPETSHPKATVLVVDDDESMRDIARSVLHKEYRVLTAANAEEAMHAVEREKINAVLLDLCLGSDNGMDVLTRIKEFRPQIEVIMITVVRELKSAVEAMKRGAFDYLTKEFDYDELRATVDRALEHQQNAHELRYLRTEIKNHTKRDLVFGATEIMQRVQDIARKAASGTGKEMLARRIHEWSDRAANPFITVNLASIPSELIESSLFGHEKGSFTGAYALQLGKFEAADGGTLFLDEIGELRIDLQVKLLRAIQEEEIDRVGSTKPIPINVRLIAATNVDLKRAVAEGKFREELYYRLNVLPIHLPPLRERKEDIPQMVDLFVHRYCTRFHRPLKRMAPEALGILRQHYWPGNVRELENLMERLVAITEGDIITEYDVPVEYRLSPYTLAKGAVRMRDALKAAVEGFTRTFLLQVLDEEDWHQANAAGRLGIHRKTLEYKMRRLNIQRKAGPGN